ncbi:MAG: SdiA-regulated domain-containing protein [Melioribacteraceae bacterium]|nr:SdiA-regulated domain-containing protein [Melioribacteraceae bacterium]
MKQAFISLIFILFIIGCREKKINEFPQLISKISIKVPEPSGLTFSNDGKNLITVSDANSTIYWMTFKGEIVKQISFDGYDYEAVTSLDKNTIAVALEDLREIKYLTEAGKILFTHKTNITGEINKGFEGLAFNKKNHHTYIANEKNPCMLLELDDSLQIISQTVINFVSDISGLFYEEKNDILWLISDESRALVKCDLKGKLLKKYNIAIEKIEGIAVDSEKKLIYIVSDLDETLYIFKLPE